MNHKISKVVTLSDVITPNGEEVAVAQINDENIIKAIDKDRNLVPFWGGAVSSLVQNTLELSSAQLKAVLTGAIIVPDPLEGQFITNVTISTKYKAGATAYDSTDANYQLNSETGIDINIPIENMINSLNNSIYVQTVEPYVLDSPQGIGAGIDKGIYLSNLASVPTLGDGTLIIIATYRIYTF